MKGGLFMNELDYLRYIAFVLSLQITYDFLKDIRSHIERLVSKNE